MQAAISRRALAPVWTIQTGASALPAADREVIAAPSQSDFLPLALLHGVDLIDLSGPVETNQPQHTFLTGEPDLQ